MNPDLFATDGGISFGYAVQDPYAPQRDDIEAHPLRYVGDRHILTYAPSGAGKSRRLLLNNIIQLPNWSLLILDIKGELAMQTRHYREHVARNRVVQLNPFRALGMPSNGYNPVAALEIGADFVDDAMALAEALVRIEGPDSHWGASAQDLLCAIILYSRLRGPDGGSLGHVREILGKPSPQFVKLVAEMIEAGVRAKVFEIGIKLSRFLDLDSDSRELHSILSTAMTQTRFLDSPPMKADLRKGAFDFAEMKTRPITCYVNLTANRLGSHSPYLRIVLTAFLQSMLKDSSAGAVPILVMLDETAQLGKLDILQSSIAVLRGYGVKVWQLWQDLPQHQSIFGDNFESTVANSGVLHAFAPQDMTTANFLSQRSGQNTAAVLGYSAPPDAFRGKAAEGNMSLSFTPVPGVLPQELMGLPEGMSILFSHKTPGRVFGYLPDPSEVAAFDRILRQR